MNHFPLPSRPLSAFLLLCLAGSACASGPAATEAGGSEAPAAAGTATARPALAANVVPATGSLFASLTSSQHGLDSDRGGLGDDTHHAFGLGYRYTDRLAVELTGGRTETASGAVAVDIDTLRVDSLWFFDPAGGWQPWFAAGLTDQRLKSGGPAARETLLGAGMGMFRHIGGPFGVRAEWRTAWSLDEKQWDSLAGIGLVVSFGGERHLPSLPR